MQNATATATATRATRSMVHVKTMMPEYFKTSIVSATQALYDKDEARLNLARAIIGACLEFGHSGNDGAIKQARETLQAGRGKGAQVRARALVAIQSARDGMKARALVALDDTALLDWVDIEEAGIIMALTPPARAAKPATEGATATDGATATEGATAPQPLPNAPALAAILAAIDAGMYDRSALEAIAGAVALATAEPAPV